MSWLSDTSSNIFRKSFISGFLDVSGPTIIRDNSGIRIDKDFSMNGVINQLIQAPMFDNNIYVGGNVIADINIGKRLFVYSDASLGAKLFLLGDAILDGKLIVVNDVSFNGNLYSKNILINKGDVSINSRLFVSGDASMNSRLFVSGDVSMNGRLFVRRDASFSTNIFIKGASVFMGDVSINSRLFVNGDVSINSRLSIANDISLNGNIGIGKWPQYNLDISGNVNVSSGTINNTYYNNYSNAAANTSYLTTVIPNTPNIMNDFSANGRFGTQGFSWTNNNIIWIASSSSFDQNAFGRMPYRSFDLSLSNNGWGTKNPVYTTTNPFRYSPGNTYIQYNTEVNIVGSISGEWLQIQSNVPVVLNSYKIYYAATANSPVVYTICGSEDGNVWDPIFDVSYTSWKMTNTVTGPYGSTIDGNGAFFPIPSGTETLGTVTGNGSTTVSYRYNTYNNSNNPYTCFRMIIKNILGNNLSSGYAVPDGYSWFQEWAPVFTVPTVTGPTNAVLFSDPSKNNILDVSGTLGLVNSNSSLITATPNSKDASYYTWTNNNWMNNNITWTVSASSEDITSGRAFRAFNGAHSDRWSIASSNYNTASPFAYKLTTSQTTINGSGISNPVYGDWIQIDSSIPLIIKTFSIMPYSTVSANNTGNLPGTFYICGSNDGSNWYAIMNTTFAALPFASTTTQAFTPAYTIPSGSVSGSTSGGGTGSINYTTYGNSFNSYSYFRFVVTNLLGSTIGGSTDGYLLLGELSLVFTPPNSSVSLGLDSGTPNQLNVGGTLNVTNNLNVAGQLNVGTTINRGGYALFGLSTLTYAAAADMVWTNSSGSGAYSAFRNRIFLNGQSTGGSGLANSIITLQDPGVYVIIAKFNADVGFTSQTCNMLCYFWNTNASTPAWVNCGNSEFNRTWNNSTELTFFTMIQATTSNFNIKFTCSASTSITWSSEIVWSKLMIHKVG
jgi:hypothetical protein